jgi:hypothetical protein
MHTVIVLGAGASKAAGFSTGEELVEGIARKFQDEDFLNTLKRILWNNFEIIAKQYSTLMPGRLLDYIGKNPIAFIRNPVPQLNDWLKLLSSADTIDDFIYYRPEYSIFAKLGILAVLSEKEDDSYWDPDSKGKIRKNWYNKFWGIINYECKTASDLVKRLSKLTVITFNYDRSLDYFLYCQIYSRYHKDIQKLNVENKFKIYHVYGSTGDLLDNYSLISRPYSPIDFSAIPNQQSPFYMNRWTDLHKLSREFGEFVKFDRYILNLSLGIKTYNEELTTETGTKYIDIIQSASHLYFFGFAFHPQNMDVLFPKNAVEKSSIISVSGTCYGMPVLNLQRAANRFSLSYPKFNGHFTVHMNAKNREIDIDSFLHNTGIRIDD